MHNNPSLYSDWMPVTPSMTSSESNAEEEISQSDPEMSKPSINLSEKLSVVQLPPNSVTHIRDASEQDPRARRRESQLNELRSLLKRDAISADMKWSLFVSASRSYDYNINLEPFPNKYTSDISIEDKDVSAVEDIILKAPSNNLIFRKIYEPSQDIDIPDDLIELMYWVLVTKLKPYIKTLDPQEANMFYETCGIKQNEKPSLVFQIINSSKSIAEQKWNNIALATGYEVKVGYLTPHMEHVHSIIHNGAAACMGQGNNAKSIYLSTNIGPAKKHSIQGCTWSGSLVGSEYSCVVRCEIIEHPEKVVKQKASSTDVVKGKFSKSNENYYVVSDPELVIVRHLLFYPEGGKIRTFVNRAKSPCIQEIPTDDGKPHSLWASIFNVVAIYCALVLLSSSFYSYWQSWKKI